jgi:tRNA(Leu) C34 or U34 (ribose-2'-O)-methylase TrmL
MEVLEIVENPGIAVRVCGIYNTLLIVVKFFGDELSDRSMKIYEKPERLGAVKSHWNTKTPIHLSDVRATEYIKRSNEFINLTAFFTALSKQKE